METGFFTLRPCRQQTIGRCSHCGRGLCQRHITAAPSGAPLCLDCMGRARDDAQEPWTEEGVHWTYRLRRQLHRRRRPDRHSSSWPEPFWVTGSYDDSWQRHDHDLDTDWDDDGGTYFDS